MDSKLLLDTEELKRLRKSQGLSQEGLAYACEQQHLRVSIATIKRAESGKLVSYRTAHELATFFGIELKRLLHSMMSVELDADTSLPEQAQKEEQHVLSILWLRLDGHENIVDVMNILQRRGSIWQEQLGNTIIAIFGNFGMGGKGHIHAQMVALEIKNFLLTEPKSPVHFYGAIQLGPVRQNPGQTELTPQVLHWFALHSTMIPVGSIVVSTDLYQLSSSHFSYRPHTQGEEDLWLLENAICLEQTLPLFGRSAELLQINAIIDSVKQCSNPALIHLTGQAGIGKSRLLSSIHEQARLREILIADIDLEAGWQDPVQVLTNGLCHRIYERAKSRWTERQLREVFYASANGIEQQLIFAELLGIRPPELDDFEQWRIGKVPSEEELLQAITAILTILLKQHASGLLVTIDNIHLLKQSGERLLTNLLARCSSLPFACIVTSRVETNATAVLQNLVGEGFNLTTISLGPLSKLDVENLCKHFGDLGEAYKQHCIRLSDGVPLYLVQLLTKQSDRRQGEVPSSLKLLVEQKLLQLSENDRRVVELLSVSDGPLPLSSLAELLQQQEYSPESLVRNQLVKVDVELGIKLTHQLVRHFVYHRLPQQTRHRYHGVLAEFIEQRFDKLRGINTSSLARHFEQAGKQYKAALYYYESATEHLHKGLYDEALISLNKALELLSSSHSKKCDDLEINIQLALSGVYKVKYGWVSPLLKSSYQRVVSLCEQLGSDRRLAMALFGLWAIELSTLNFKNAEDLANRCLEISTQLDDAQGSMHAYTALSNTLFWRGKHRQAEEAARIALSLYRPAYSASSIQLLGQDPRALAGCFGAWSASLLGEVDKAESYRRTMMNEVRQLKHDFSLAIAVQGSAWLDFHLDKPQETLTQAEELDALSEKMGFPYYRGVAALFIGWARHKLYQDPDAAYVVDHGYRQLFTCVGDKIGYSLYCTILGEIYIDTGRHEEALDLLEDGIALAIEHNEDCYLPEMYRLLASCVEGEQREQYLLLGLNYTQENPVFNTRILALQEIVCE